MRSVIALLILLTALIPAASAAQILDKNDMPDPALRRAVGKALHTGPERINTIALATRLTELHVSDAALHTLAGIERAANLYRLYINDGAVSSTVHISTTHQLYHLDLDGADVYALRLGPQPKLQSLTARGNQIDNLDELALAPNITTLDLDDNPLTDRGIESIVRLTQLVHLSAERTALSTANALARLMSIERVYLAGSYLSDVSAFASPPSLHVLDISDTHITNLEALTHNPGLGAGDVVIALALELDDVSLCQHIPTLEARGVTVHFDGTCQQLNAAAVQYMDTSFTGDPLGTASQPRNLISAAAQYVQVGGEIRIAPGELNEPVTLTKPMRIIPDTRLESSKE